MSYESQRRAMIGCFCLGALLLWFAYWLLAAMPDSNQPIPLAVLSLYGPGIGVAVSLCSRRSSVLSCPGFATVLAAPIATISALILYGLVLALAPGTFVSDVTGPELLVSICGLLLMLSPIALLLAGLPAMLAATAASCLLDTIRPVES